MKTRLLTRIASTRASARAWLRRLLARSPLPAVIWQPMDELVERLAGSGRNHR